MLRSAFIYALRNLKRNKLSSIINILGFSIGIAAFLLIVSYIKFEKENDSFYKDVDKIYRVGINFINSNGLVENAMVQFPVGPVLKEEFAEVEEYSRMWSNYNLTVKFGDIQFYEKNIYNVDANFPKIFCEMVSGDIETCLDGENNAIISEEIAKKYFGDENPIGKDLDITDYGLHRVTGVFKNRSNKSHFDFEILIPLITLTKDFEDNWNSHNFYTYVKLNRDATPENFTAKINEMAMRRYGNELYEKSGVNEEYFLKPIDEIRLYSDSLMDFKQNGHGYYIPFFVLTAAIMLLFAMFNYFNFTSSQAVEKSRTIGINRVLGAGKKSIFSLFLIESFIFIFISTVIGAIIALVCFPAFSQYYGLTYDIDLFSSLWFWQYLIIIIIVSTFISGVYPAIISYSFKLSEVIRGRGKVSRNGIKVRKILTVLQYTISCLLIIFSLVSYNQIEFMRNHELGFDKDDVLIVRAPVILPDNTTPQRAYDLIKNATDQNPNVGSMTFSDYVPGGHYERYDRIKVIGGEDFYETFMNSVSDNFIDFYKIELLSGRNFSLDIQTDFNESVIINEKLANILGFTAEEAINHEIQFDGTKKIIGVISDFHQESLKNETAPYLFFLTDWPDYFAFKLTGANTTNTVNQIGEAWTAVFPRNPYDFFFLDQYFDQNYTKDNKAWNILRLYSALAILIAILGLLGAVVHQVKQRTREIAMYKVFGADRWSILWVFLKSTFVLIGISFLIGLPIQIFILRGWLSTYPYRIDLNVIHFVIPLIILILITFLTISSQVFKVISSNLVSSLRSE
jgi:putative ABC transport system permease protein